MKHTIHIIGTETTIIRKIRQNLVKYNNEQFLVFEKAGVYQIDIDRPVRTELDRFSDEEIMTQAKSILYRQLTSEKADAFDSPERAKDFFLTQHHGLKAERIDIACLDNRHRLIESRPMFHGTIDAASVYPREIVRACIDTNAAAIFCAHNHPSGVAEPSRADIEITKRISKSLALIDVRVLDHIITGNGYAVSLAERGEM
ncbi:MAG: JAB domain-containing protein [Pseudomonadota bacterium]